MVVDKAGAKDSGAKVTESGREDERISYRAKLQKLEKSEQELAPAINSSESELTLLQEKLATSEEDLQKVQLEKAALLRKQSVEQPHSPQHITLPHAMQILAELVAQMGALKLGFVPPPPPRSGAETRGGLLAVSYTHLTLPTILLV
eukprot:1695855-Amphidinium_carterae.1